MGDEEGCFVSCNEFMHHFLWSTLLISKNWRIVIDLKVDNDSPALYLSLASLLRIKAYTANPKEKIGIK